MVDKKTKILARLKLAQELLEGSDKLKGSTPSDENFNPFYHPRHERESLIIYLLLTCFDFLGQPAKVISFDDWLKNKNEPYQTERADTFNSLSKELNHFEISIELYKKYKEIYGVKNSFYRGINDLSEELKKKLLNSINVSFVEGQQNAPKNVSLPSKPIEDEKRKLKYLYEKRNSFTHSLEQYHICSAPIFSNVRFENGASWLAFINDSRLIYGCVNQDLETYGKNDAYCYSTIGWPFILFETLYKAIKVPFDITDIDLLFQLRVNDKNEVITYNNVTHKDLYNFICEGI